MTFGCEILLSAWQRLETILLVRQMRPIRARPLGGKLIEIVVFMALSLVHLKGSSTRRQKVVL